MKKLPLILVGLIIGFDAHACTTCNKPLQEAIFNHQFLPNLFVMLLPFFVLAALVVILFRIGTARDKKNTSIAPPLHSAPLAAAATTIGIGIGGFIDGIVFHQILQWHQMVSNRIPPTTLLAKNVNMFWDGIFHAFCLIVTLTGVYLLWKIAKRTAVVLSDNLFAGGLVTGWGIFNIVEGLADHHLLKLHNVREISSNVDAWNYSFLVFSLVLLIVGFILMRKGRMTVA